jgi:hypothetical protein
MIITAALPSKIAAVVSRRTRRKRDICPSGQQATDIQAAGSFQFPQTHKTEHSLS